MAARWVHHARMERCPSGLTRSRVFPRHARKWGLKECETDLDMASRAVVRLILHDLAANQLLCKVCRLCHLLHIIPHQNARATLRYSRMRPLSMYLADKINMLQERKGCLIQLEQWGKKKVEIATHLYIWEVFGEGLNVVLGVCCRAFLQAGTQRTITVYIRLVQFLDVGHEGM